MDQAVDQAPVAGLPPYSVVIPNFNHSRYLEAALNAHLGQSVPPLEIIVVDDASSDESVAIVERLAMEHPRLRLIRLASNGGVNAAINRGLREARGDYVKISAADDVVAATLAARSLEILARHPTAGFGSCDSGVSVGERGPVQPLPQFVSDRPCRLMPGDIVRLVRHNLIGFPSNTILYRRDALLALGPTYLAFGTSFAFIGIMWINHHRLFNIIRRCDNRLMFLNLLLLFGVTWIPFPTALLAEYVGHPGAHVGAFVYSGSFFVIAILFQVLWRYATGGGRLLGDRYDRDMVESITRQYTPGPFLYLVALAVGLWSATASLILNMLLAAFFALPPTIMRRVK